MTLPPYRRTSCVSKPSGTDCRSPSSQTATVSLASQPPSAADSSARTPRPRRYGGSAKTRSNGRPGHRPRLVASHRFKVATPSARKRPMFRSITVRAAESLSTKWTDAAPRDSASRPSAPVPAKRSRTCRPVTRSPNLPFTRRLKMFSRTRSAVGRRGAGPGRETRRFPDGGSHRRVPRYRPAMILTAAWPSGCWTGRPQRPDPVSSRPRSGVWRPCRLWDHSSHQRRGVARLGKNTSVIP